MICVYLLNRYTKKKKTIFAISLIGVTVFTCLKLVGKLNKIEFLFSEKFINTYFIILCFILYIPILIGSYTYIKHYINSKNILKPKSSIIQGVLIFLLLVGADWCYNFWFIFYVYIF